MKLLDKEGLEYYTGKVKGTLTNYYTKTETNTLLGNKENISNKVTSISSSSTDTQYPSAKCVYDSQATQDTKITNLENQVFGDETIEGEGTSLTLDGTLKGQFNELDLKGNTSQDGTPTPTSPIPVNVVSGDNEIEVCEKNLVNIDDFNVSNYPDYKTIYNVKGNQQYTLQWTKTRIATYTNQYIYNFRIIEFYNGNVLISSLNGDSAPSLTENGTRTWTKVLTTPDNCNKISIDFSNNNGDTTTSIKVSNVMFEIGNITSPTYEPYQGKTYNIDLPEGIELCKIGDYQDYFYKDSGKWYLHKEIGKVVLNGSENWSAFTSVNYEYQLALFQGLNSDTSNQYFPALCNRYTNHNTTGANLLNYEFSHFSADAGYGKYRFIRIRNNEVTTLESWKAGLQNNNLILYVPLATPTTEEITYQPLIDQLNLLEKAMSKDSQTNISQVNNDLPFIISASAFLNNINGKIALLNKLTEV